MVDFFGCAQGLVLSGVGVLLGSPFHVELHVELNPMYSFVIQRHAVFA